MADGKVLGDLLHVLGVEERVVAGFVWRRGRREGRGRSQERTKSASILSVSRLHGSRKELSRRVTFSFPLSSADIRQEAHAPR